MSTAKPTTVPATAPATSAIPPSQEILPSATALVQAAKLSIQTDKPIKLDFFIDTYTQKAFIGEDSADPKEKVLVRAKDEFTSTIQKLYKISEEYIVVTENSLYLVSTRVQKRRINLAQMQAEADKIDYEEM